MLGAVAGDGEGDATEEAVDFGVAHDDRREMGYES
jgi:hypothetical protein